MISSALSNPLELRAPEAPRRPSRARAKPLAVERHYTLEDLPEHSPKHLQHCHALGARDWWIWLWEEKHPGYTLTRVPYLCHSWRCPSCRVHESHVAWTRMTEAFAPLDASGACLIVLTLDRYGTYSGEKRWQNAQEAYKDLSKLSNDMMKRLRKWMKSMGWTVLENQWVATVEMHKSGWPHVNFVVWSPELAAWLAEEKRQKLSDGMTADASRYVSRQLADIVTAAGWGLMSTAERANSREETLGYICKLAGKVDESIGEISKLTQLPTNAPFRFRRIRSGVAFLPKRKKSAVMTGTLVRRQNSNDGTRDVLPIHDIKKLDVIPVAESCCAHEEHIWLNELETAHRCARQVKQFGMRAVEVPAVTRWFKFQRLPQGPPRKPHATDQLFEPATILSQSAA